MDATRFTIHLENDTDRWQWRCPEGHTQWEPTNDHWWCQQCASSWREDVDPVFYELRNVKTGENAERHEVTLMTDVGPMKPRKPAD